jgi:hypothetical protein
MTRDRYGRYHIKTNRKWQGGPASITLEIDAMNDVGAEVGLILSMEAKCRQSGTEEAVEIAKNVGTFEFTARGPVSLRHSLMIEIKEARELRDALTKLIGDMENVLENGWEK